MLRHVMAHITPYDAIDGKFTIDGDRLTVRLVNTDSGLLKPGDIARIEGFDRWRFQDGFAEFIRKDYVGENVTRCAFRRIRAKLSIDPQKRVP